MKEIDFSSLARQFCEDGVVAISLMGSFAREEAGIFSDIDLVRFHDIDGPERHVQTSFVDQMFIVVSDVSPFQADEWFTDPEKASSCIAGVRSGKALWDPQDYFGAIQRRAHAFVWDAIMQKKADAWASERLVGRLYVHTAELLNEIISKEHKPLVDEAVLRIRGELDKRPRRQIEDMDA